MWEKRGKDNDNWIKKKRDNVESWNRDISGMYLSYVTNIPLCFYLFFFYSVEYFLLIRIVMSFPVEKCRSEVYQNISETQLEASSNGVGHSLLDTPILACSHSCISQFSTIRHWRPRQEYILIKVKGKSM